MEAYSRFRAGDANADQSLDFLSSHPDAPKRLELATRHARAFGPPGTGTRDRDMYLKGISGLLYGDSPNEGYVRGPDFPAAPGSVFGSASRRAFRSTTRRRPFSQPARMKLPFVLTA